MKSITAQRPKKVLVAILATGFTGWQKRAGVFRYIGEGRPWDVRLASTNGELEALAMAGDVFDGIILNAADFHLAEKLQAGARRPMVLFDVNLPEDSPLLRRPTGTIFIHHDSKAIGEAAASHLLADGRLRSFAYLDMPDATSWSDQRRNTFQKALHRAGFPLRILSSGENLETLAREIAHLPRPIGFFVATDRLALPAYSVCRKAKLAIPADVAVLGVDDDMTICESMQPPLSSVRLNSESIGYTAAKLLDDLMTTPSRKTRHVTLQSQPTIMRRNSTSAESPYGRLVERGLSYIAAHATDGIGPDDVARHLGISRRSLDMRFHQTAATTVLQAIQECRLQAVKRLLLETNETIETITGKCGYGSVNHLKKIFRQHFGCSMRTWRHSAAAQRP